MPDANKLADRLAAHAQHPILPAEVRETMRQLTQWVLETDRAIYQLRADLFRNAQRIERAQPKEAAPDGAPDQMPSL
jgi:hypothetical protein